MLVKVDADMIREAIVNLLSNAMRYTDVNGLVGVTVAEPGRCCHFCFRYRYRHCEGRHTADLSRFWRSDSSRERASGGLESVFPL